MLDCFQKAVLSCELALFPLGNVIRSRLGAFLQLIMQFIFKHFIGFFALLILSALAGLAQPCTAMLSGRAVDEHNGELLSYARIYIPILEKGAISDSSGFYQIAELCPGIYEVECSHIGCETVKATINIAGKTVHDFYPEHHADALATVFIQGKKLEKVRPRRQTLLSRHELSESKGQSLGDALRAVAGVTVLHTGNSISKPVIHGLHSNRILIMNNGVRLEGQQWGSEHAPEIDPFAAEELAVVKGANGVRYGPDAIAGVILVNPRHLRTEAGIGAELNLVGFSNGRQGNVAAMVEGKGKRVAALQWRLQGSLKRGGNVRTPTYYLKNTGLGEANFSAVAAYTRARYGLEVYYSEFRTDLGIFAGAHIGNLTDLQLAFEAAEPLERANFTYVIGRPRQYVTHKLLKAKAFFRTGTLGKMTLTYARQANLRFEFDKHGPRNDSLAALQLPAFQFRIGTHTGEAVWEHFRRGGFAGSIGATGIYQGNYYQGRFFIPNFRKYGGGVFWLEQWQARDSSRLKIETGLRYDYIFQQIFMWQDNVIVTPKFDYHNLSGSLGATFQVSETLLLRGNLGTAWRPPGVNELFSKGLHHGAAAVEIGDTSLQQEKALNFTLGADFTSEKVDIFLEGYANSFENFIYLVPELPPTLTIRGAFPTFRYQQVRALLTGLDLTARIRFTPQITLTSKVATLLARNQDSGEFLVQMPADRLENTLEYKIPRLGPLEETYFSMSSSHVRKQNRVQAGSDFVPPPEAYTLLSLQIGSEIPFQGQQVQIGLGVHNLLNVSYRDYLNRFRYYADEMGRNISFRLTLPLEIISAPQH